MANDVYTENMGRNLSESERLDEQFELLSKIIGYDLHPSVIGALPPDPAIADIGTGTGIFLARLAETYPTATLRGFDISPALFRAKDALPGNVSLDIMDIKQGPDNTECNKYDVVHVRLLAAGINPSEWTLVLGNALKLLKPGGAIQWGECNWAGVQHLRGGVSSSVATARSMGARFKEGLKDKFSSGWNSLPQLMDEAGLVGIKTDVVGSDRVIETRKSLTTNGMQAIFAWARLMSARGVLGSLTTSELDVLEQDAYKDIDSGCYVRFDTHVALGFKKTGFTISE